jgi:uncharacterized protein (TIGR02391 family)
VVENLIRQGRLLRDQIRKHYDPGYDTLPPEEQIAEAELEGWYSGVAAALEQRYGPQSPELMLWKEGLERIKKEAWEEFGKIPPGGGYFVQRYLNGSLGLLAQIKLLRQQEPGDVTTLSFSTFHQEIAAKCQPLFAVGAYDAAVFEAFRTVEDAVRERTRSLATDIGVTLMSKVMNPKAPLLRFSDIVAEQEGYHSLFRGAIGAFKNPVSHRTVGHSDAMRVMELLNFASLLLRLLDDAAK